MPAILEIPEVRERISPLSVDEYHRLGEVNERGRRTELVRGLVIEKRSKSPLHRSVASLLYKFLLARLPAGCSVWKEKPLTFADSEPESDISVTRGTESDFAVAHPGTAELVVEIAVSSAALDRENANLYAEAGVKEYWIVLAPQKQVEVYRRPDGGSYRQKRLLAADQTLDCATLPGVRILVGDLFPQ